MLPMLLWAAWALRRLALPSLEIPAEFADHDALSYLGGRTMNELFAAEREGTRIALTDANRPNVTIQFPAVTAHVVGQYLYQGAVLPGRAGHEVSQTHDPFTFECELQ